MSDCLSCLTEPEHSQHLTAKKLACASKLAWLVLVSQHSQHLCQWRTSWVRLTTMAKCGHSQQSQMRLERERVSIPNTSKAGTTAGQKL